MGTLFSKLDDKMPELYSFAEYEKIVNQVNLISTQISKHTNFILTVEVLSLQLDYNNWKNSLIKATLGVSPQKVFKSRLFQEDEEMEKQPQYSFKQTFSFVVTMRELYNIFDLLKFFKKQNTGQRNTLTKTPLFQEGKGCQICFDEVADLALPCGHIFGANCISKYIIDKEQRSCPMCRRQFIGRRSAIEKDLYIVIDEDESIYSEVKACLFEILKKRNENTMKSVLNALDIKNKPQI